jgi:hypothetical protein
VIAILFHRLPIATNVRVRPFRQPLGFWQSISSHPMRALALLLSFVLLLAPLSILCVRVNEPARALMAVKAQSEIMAVEDVQNADLRIPLDGATLLTETAVAGGAPAGAPLCLHGLFTPAQHTALNLRRSEQGPLVVEVLPNSNGIGGEWTDGKGSHTLRGGLVFRIGTVGGPCKARSTVVRIPIGGRVVLGEDFGPPARLDSPRPILLSGDIDIFGRASPPFGVTLGIRLPDSLYSGGSLKLPAGARLRECDGNTSWWGFVETRFGSGDPGDRAMNVALTTSARQLALTTPGGAKTRDNHAPVCKSTEGGAGEADDVVAVSTFARLFADPYVSILWTGMVAAFAVSQTIFAALSIPPPVRKS